MTTSKLNPKLKIVEAQFPTEAFNGIAIVGEAPGENEAIQGKPFIGSSGKLLDSLLRAAGISRNACLVTNVFTERPPQNAVGFFFEKKGVVKEEWKHEIQRLKSELERYPITVCIALGATALWALTGLEGISKFRGTVVSSTLVTSVKVLPTFHPAYVMRQWTARPTVGKDLMKARIEAQTSRVIRPEREVWICPTLADLTAFEQYMPGDLLTVDIETDPWNVKQVLCIGFAPSAELALVVPFLSKSKPGWSYWPTAEEEAIATEWCAKYLENKDVPKLMQNGVYDMQWLERKMGIKVRGTIEDTMIMHHAIEPELERGLAFLSSIYTNETAWKSWVDWGAMKKAGKEGA
jgi:DNA polymerase